MTLDSSRYDLGQIAFSKNIGKEPWLYENFVLPLRTDNQGRLFLFKTMNGLYTIILLIMSNIFMTLAWYGHLKLSESGISNNWPLFGVIAFSWGIAFLEYCCQVPANRLGFIENGGPFNLIQLKVIQECISLAVFCIIANIMFQGTHLHWNHILAFLLIICAVYLVFMK